MNLTKFDLYNPEWLEIVFDSRNKNYGAYDLRRHYAENLSKAMGIAFLGVSFLFISYGIFAKHTAIETIRQIEVPIPQMAIPPPPKVIPTKPSAHVTRPPSQAPTIKYTEFVPRPDPLTVNPPTTEQIAKSAIGPETTKGNGTDSNVLKADPGPNTTGTVATSSTPVDAGSLEVMPEPYGGAAAWAKFLQKHIHYPPQASDANAQGKVFLSFIIETDGHLSNIQVERGAGFGLDEEALRVLKLAPAWKPGIQNGHPVRVKYTIPINFTLSDSE